MSRRCPLRSSPFRRPSDSHVAPRRDGRRLILTDWGELTLIERTAAETVSTPVTREQVPWLLAERLELPGFELDAAGRVTRPQLG